MGAGPAPTGRQRKLAAEFGLEAVYDRRQARKYAAALRGCWVCAASLVLAAPLFLLVGPLCAIIPALGLMALAHFVIGADEPRDENEKELVALLKRDEQPPPGGIPPAVNIM